MPVHQRAWLRRTGWIESGMAWHLAVQTAKRRARRTGETRDTAARPPY
jgi:hypothetical protein